MDPLTIWIIVGIAVASIAAMFIAVVVVGYLVIAKALARVHDRELRVASREQELMRDHAKIIEKVMPVVRHTTPSANPMQHRTFMTPANVDNMGRGDERDGYIDRYEVESEVAVGQVDS